jgi:hypothetical protein
VLILTIKNNQTMAHTNTIALPANNNTYVLSVGTVYKELRNRGWHVLAGTIANRFSGPKDTMTGAEFRLDLYLYESKNPLSRSTDNGDGLLKIMVEACEMEKSTWNKKF